MSEALAWILLGLGLIAAEFFLPGFVAIFVGVAALAVGLLLWAGMPGGSLPFVVFAVMTLAMVFLLRRHFQDMFAGNSIDGPRDGVDDDFIGHEARVVDGFDSGDPDRGTVHFRGTNWNARSDDGPFERDSVVVITGRDGITLVVGPEQSA